MKVLVTGGAGYIGTHTVLKLVEAGYDPVILDNLSNSRIEVLENLNGLCGRNIPFYQVDCTDGPALARVLESENVDGVIHFAAYTAVGESVANPLKY